jgi:hypothetical protein
MADNKISINFTEVRANTASPGDMVMCGNGQFGLVVASTFPLLAKYNYKSADKDRDWIIKNNHGGLLHILPLTPEMVQQIGKGKAADFSGIQKVTPLITASFAFKAKASHGVLSELAPEMAQKVIESQGFQHRTCASYPGGGFYIDNINVSLADPNRPDPSFGMRMGVAWEHAWQKALKDKGLSKPQPPPYQWQVTINRGNQSQPRA